MRNLSVNNKFIFPLQDYAALFFAVNQTALISITDSLGNITYANEQFVKASKYSETELIGQNHRILKSGDQPQALFDDLWQTISAGHIWRGEIKNKAKDGSIYWVDSTIAPIINSTGQPEQYISVRLLITDRKLAEEKLRQTTVEKSELVRANQAVHNILEDLTAERKQVELDKAEDEAILQNIGDGLMVVDRRGYIILINAAFEKMLGWTRQEVIGKLFSDVIIRQDEKGVGVPYDELILPKVLAGNTAVTAPTYHASEATIAIPVTYFSRKDKSIFAISGITAPVIMQGEIIGAVEIFRDITKEQAVDKAKTEFVSLASHQLRTPLTTISWYTEMILNGSFGHIIPNQKKYLEEIYHGNKRMIELVNTLLDVSRLELGTLKIEVKPTAIIGIAEGVLADQQPTIIAKKLKVTSSFGKNIPLLMVDPKMLRIVLQNLLSNAVKYTPDGGRIKFSVTLIDGETVSIQMADTGYGIPKAQQEQIFTKLFRADNVKDKDTEGTGLGLYIAKQVITNFGGKIWFESEENKGSTFYVTLPVDGVK